MSDPAPAPPDLDTLLAPEPAWQRLPGWSNRRDPAEFFVNAEPDPRLTLRCYRRSETRAETRAEAPSPHDRIVGKAWLGRGAQGPPGHVHGGALATIVDHALGMAAWLTGRPCFTASLTYEYKALVPIESVVWLEAWVVRIEKRKIHTAARLYVPVDGTGDTGDGAANERLYGAARALFIQVPDEHLERFGILRERIHP